VYEHVPSLHAAPTLWIVSHDSPHAPQLAAPPVGVSQPFRSGAVVVQSAKPIAQAV
jgi:hypothetical protein